MCVGGGGVNYKIEKQNKQIKTFQVVLLTRPGVCVCVLGGGRGRGGEGGATIRSKNKISKLRPFKLCS